jgi:hypothetical protein
MSLRRTKSPNRWESELEELRSFIEESFPGIVLTILLVYTYIGFSFILTF